MKVCKEWEKRTRLDLEHDVYVKVYQKDVNNYIIVDAKGKYKSKGAYVKKLNDLDNDLPIVNKALVNKLIYDKSIEDTINECDNLKDFQKIVKVSRDYECAMFGDTPLSERVLRVFASLDETDKGIFKFRNGKADKVGNTPEVAFIYNDDVNNVKCPSKLDKSWYIDLANKRYDDFMAREVVEEGLDAYELIDDTYTDFIQVIIDIKEKSIHKNKEFKDLISIGYFSRFGSVKKLLAQYELFTSICGKKSIAISKLLELGVSIGDIAKYGNVATKNVTKLNSELLYHDLCDKLPNDEYDLQTLIKFQIDILGKVSYTNESHDKMECVVLDIDKINNKKSKIRATSLNNNKTADFYIEINVLYNDMVCKGDIINILSVRKEFKPVPVKDNDGKIVGWDKDYSTVEWWINAYTKL